MGSDTEPTSSKPPERHLRTSYTSTLLWRAFRKEKHTTMETLNPAVLRQKSALELFEMRKRVVSDLQAQAALTEGREPNDYERALEERAENKYNGILNAQQLSERDNAAVEWFKSAIVEKNPSHFDIVPDEKRDFSISQPGLEWERRDTLKSTATQAMPVSVYPRFIEYMVEHTPVLRAGALLIRTSTGEDLQVPRLTSVQTANLTAEGASITESDPTAGVVTLKSYKYAAFWQLSRELVDDTPTNLLDALARGAATALALAYGPHLATGTGSDQPSGYANATVSVTGPTGATGGFGTQATAGQGTDLLVDLISSIPEPYLLSP
jgi:HK97 family phage major capsid protein